MIQSGHVSCRNKELFFERRVLRSVFAQRK